MADILPFPSAATLLERARSNAERRPHFRQQAPERQGLLVQQEARRLAIASSPIGATAARIGSALSALTREVEAFLRNWPDSDEALFAVRAALAAAGLEWSDVGPHVEFDYAPDFLNCVPAELVIWAGVLSVAADRLEECVALNETGETERRAA